MSTGRIAGQGAAYETRSPGGRRCTLSVQVLPLTERPGMIDGDYVHVGGTVEKKRDDALNRADALAALAAHLIPAGVTAEDLGLLRAPEPECLGRPDSECRDEGSEPQDEHDHSAHDHDHDHGHSHDP